MAGNHGNPSPHILRRREYDGPEFLRQGFRPFFLGAGVWAAIAMGLWLWVLIGNQEPFGRSPALPWLAWHIHEMIFGFASAAIAGFLLTAIPNWTGRLPVRGWPLAGLAGLWLAGRLLGLAYDHDAPAAILPLFQPLADIAFLAVLAGLVINEIRAGQNWRNIPVAALISLLALSHLVFYASRWWGFPDDGFPEMGITARSSIMLIVILLTLIGGRITPSFTRNWLVRSKGVNDPASLPAPWDNIDKLVMILTVIAAFIWVLAPRVTAFSPLFLAAGMGLLYRLSRWKGLDTFDEPLVTILHIGYGWPGIGFILAGLAPLDIGVPHESAVHAFTAGAIGTMTLAVMTRASRGHSGRLLSADRGTVLIYALVTLAALLRVLGPILPLDQNTMLLISGLCWIAAFTLFSLLYLPMFVQARQ